MEEPKQIGQVFKVEEPPPPTPPNRVGRENISAKAVLFCSANPGQWCKVFTYSFSDTQTRHGAHQNIRQRKASMRRVVECSGLVVEFTHAVDEALSQHNLYAKVSAR